MESPSRNRTVCFRRAIRRCGARANVRLWRPAEFPLSRRRLHDRSPSTVVVEVHGRHGTVASSGGLGLHGPDQGPSARRVSWVSGEAHCSGFSACRCRSLSCWRCFGIIDGYAVGRRPVNRVGAAARNLGWRTPVTMRTVASRRRIGVLRALAPLSYVSAWRIAPAGWVRRDGTFSPGCAFRLRSEAPTVVNGFVQPNVRSIDARSIALKAPYFSRIKSRPAPDPELQGG